MRTLTVHAYNGRDNTIDLQLEEDGRVLDELTAVTRIVLAPVDGKTLDSDDADLGFGAGQVFDTTPGGGILRIRLGGLGLTAGGYKDVSLIVFSLDNPHGIYWTAINIVIH